MGFFDRFKKKEEPQVVEQKPQPLTLQYSDGTVANITFNGTVDVDGKIVHAANIQYENPDGTFRGKSVLLEPIMSQDGEGNWIDATEQYYRQMSTRDGSRETQTSYNAVKGFFKKQDIDENIIGSNYIGNLARKESGEYFRHYDNDFRQKCIQKHMAEKQAEAEAKQQRENAFMADLQKQVETKPVNIKTSHAEHLTPEKSPFQGR